MSNATTPLFTQHSRHWRENLYVYPVISRRSRGLSIGVNLNPDKICNFDCVYCCVDRTVPPVVRDVDMEVLRGELDRMIQLARSGELFAHAPLDQTPPELRRLNDVAFSGDGEPTAAREFPEACRVAADLLGKHGFADAKIVVITNATLLSRPAVREALAFLDQHKGEIWAKLDAGTEAYYRQVERTSIPLEQVLANILDAGRTRPIVIQSLFMTLHGKGPDDAEISAYVGRLKDLAAAGCRIKLVQVYTVARWTTEPFVGALPKTELDNITAAVGRAGFKVESYCHPG
jgi:wyosine [tRNA(Phe)-imidazoG37] synthetase (radical SAM superfamily)